MIHITKAFKCMLSQTTQTSHTHTPLHTHRGHGKDIIYHADTHNTPTKTDINTHTNTSPISESNKQLTSITERNLPVCFTNSVLLPLCLTGSPSSQFIRYACSVSCSPIQQHCNEPSRCLKCRFF